MLCFVCAGIKNNTRKVVEVVWNVLLCVGIKNNTRKVAEVVWNVVLGARVLKKIPAR